MRPFTHRPILSAFVFALVLVVTVQSAAAGDLINRWSGMTALDFTQGYVRNDCAGQASCDEHALGIGDDIYLFCAAEPGYDYSCYGDVTSFTGWEMGGQAGHFPGPPPADVPLAYRLDVTGELTSADEFRLFGQTVDSAWQTDQSIELAVFRFAGDPAVFDGVPADSVQDLVDLGLIDSSDILFVEILPDHDDVFQSFEFFVDVSGVAADELVIFGAGNGPFPPHEVPAVSAGGAVALSLALLALGLWTLRRRQRRGHRGASF